MPSRARVVMRASASDLVTRPSACSKRHRCRPGLRSSSAVRWLDANFRRECPASGRRAALTRVPPDPEMEKPLFFGFRPPQARRPRGGMVRASRRFRARSCLPVSAGEVRMADPLSNPATQDEQDCRRDRSRSRSFPSCSGHPPRHRICCRPGQLAQAAQQEPGWRRSCANG